MLVGSEIDPVGRAVKRDGYFLLGGRARMRAKAKDPIGRAVH
jgi:hypothetical protein